MGPPYGKLPPLLGVPGITFEFAQAATFSGEVLSHRLQAFSKNPLSKFALLGHLFGQRVRKTSFPTSIWHILGDRLIPKRLL